MMNPPTLLVAGLSVRAMVASARRGGYQVLALDAFGDTDTKVPAKRWQAIARPNTLRIDARLAHAALHRWSGLPGLVGWVPGAGFERWPAGLAAHAEQPKMLGNAPSTWQAARDPEVFFACLKRLAIAHPPIALDAPRATAGWLRKDMQGSGGWHIRAARRDDVRRPGRYWQAIAPGQAMGALFLARRNDVQLIGVHQQLVAPHSARAGMPACGFGGTIGPIDLPERAHVQLLAAIHDLVPALDLVGLCSLDFLLHQDGIQVLELNPRPSASLSLYDLDYAGGLMRAHVNACLGDDAPAVHITAAPKLRGERIVFAPVDLVIDASSLEGLAEVHDLPGPRTGFKAGAPVCTMSASGASVAEVHEALAQAAHRANRLLSHPTHAHTGAVT